MANKVICILLNLLLILTGFIPPKLSYAQNVYFYTIAVLDLAANGISETEAKSLSESLRGQITRVATSEEFKASSGFVYKVIERSQMTKILDEFEYQSTGCTDEKALDVNGNRISGSVTVKTGSGYSAELYCYDSDNRITHSGTASDVSIVTGKETKITILLQPGLPETPLLTSLKSSVSTDSTYILTWSEVNNAKSYTIEESPDSIFTDPLKDSWFSK